MSDKERLKRDLEYVQYAINSLSSLCCLFLGVLWGYYKLLRNWKALTLALLIYAFFYFGNWALRNVSKQVLLDRGLDMKSSQALSEGKL